MPLGKRHTTTQVIEATKTKRKMVTHLERKDGTIHRKKTRKKGCWDTLGRGETKEKNDMRKKQSKGESFVESLSAAPLRTTACKDRRRMGEKGKRRGKNARAVKKKG